MENTVANKELLYLDHPALFDAVQLRRVEAWLARRNRVAAKPRHSYKYVYLTK